MLKQCLNFGKKNNLLVELKTLREILGEVEYLPDRTTKDAVKVIENVEKSITNIQLCRRK